MSTDEPQAAPRQYNSELRRQRAEDTRRRILDTATRLFSERGWSVGMREIATEAGVAFDTVYAGFKSKAQLLNQVLDVQVVGDDEPIALADRPEFAALSRGDAQARTAAAAALAVTLNMRTIGLHRAFAEGAAVDKDLAARLEAARRAQRQDTASGGAVMAGRELTSDESDGMWAVVSHEVYDLLVGSAGWTPERYEKWLATMLLDIVTPDRKDTP